MKGDGVGSSSAGGGAWGLAQLARQLCHASQGLAILWHNGWHKKNSTMAHSLWHSTMAQNSKKNDRVTNLVTLSFGGLAILLWVGYLTIFSER